MSGVLKYLPLCSNINCLFLVDYLNLNSDFEDKPEEERYRFFCGCRFEAHRI